MAKLIILLEGKLLREYQIIKERVMIGRRPSNDIQIDNLAISGEHASILTVGEDALLEDLNSTNGTLINKKSVKKQVLQHNDVIELGKYQLKFIANPALTKGVAINTNDESATAPDLPRQQTPPGLSQAISKRMASLIAAAPKPPAEVALVDPSPQPPSLAGRLQLLTGPNAGQTLLLDKAMTKLGKVGEQLALITKRPQGFFITHIGGEQRPLVNGKTIGAQAFALSDQDQIEILDEKMEFHLD